MKCKVQSCVAGTRVSAAASGAELGARYRSVCGVAAGGATKRFAPPASPCSLPNLARPFRPKTPKQRHGSHRRGGASKAYQAGGVYAPRRRLAAVPRSIPATLLFGAARATFFKQSRQQPALARCLCFFTHLLRGFARHLSNGVIETRTHDAAHELLARNAQPLAYDPRGNLTADSEGRILTWDPENRLTSIAPSAPTNGALAVAFIYDTQTRRVGKNVFAWNTDHWDPVNAHVFTYDGWNLVSETIHNSSFVITNSFVYGQDLSGTLQGAGGIGGLLCANFGGPGTPCTGYYHYNANGNVAALSDISGTTVAQYSYNPYGKVIASSGAMAAINPFRFSTKYTDDETGLIYFGYRFYSPQLGRWLNRDPLGEYDGVNLAAYCRNHFGSLDVLGLCIDCNRLARLINTLKRDNLQMIGELATLDDKFATAEYFLDAQMAVDSLPAVYGLLSKAGIVAQSGATAAKTAALEAAKASALDSVSVAATALESGESIAGAAEDAIAAQLEGLDPVQAALLRKTENQFLKQIGSEAKKKAIADVAANAALLATGKGLKWAADEMSTMASDTSKQISDFLKMSQKQEKVFSDIYRSVCP